ncbi:HAD family hydrolase [Halobacteriovorax sp. HLS]|uniref:KdsC family phosphatase n=1 Tax=Halobacteriovorax sp. HLS TaxID=2234000 RepID=UPI000FD9C6D4|nr:HAD hydrolase family protein [Halobacteriovorax sp. HLS]
MSRDLREVAKKFQAKLDKIKVVAFDVDGILTDGRVWYSGDEMGWNRFTDTSDGYGLKMLKNFGFKVGVITGGDSLSVIKRFKENLKLDFVYYGNEDKREGFQKLLDQGYKAEEVLFMGDEFFDLPLLMASGFSATVPNTSEEIKDRVDYVTSTPAPGCVREVIDIIRYSRNLYPDILDINGELIKFN